MRLRSESETDALSREGALARAAPRAHLACAAAGHRSARGASAVQGGGGDHPLLPRGAAAYGGGPPGADARGGAAGARDRLRERGRDGAQQGVAGASTPTTPPLQPAYRSPDVASSALCSQALPTLDATHAIELLARLAPPANRRTVVDACIFALEHFPAGPRAAPDGEPAIKFIVRQLPPPSRTKWTRLVHPSVLTGHLKFIVRQLTKVGGLLPVVEKKGARPRARAGRQAGARSASDPRAAGAGTAGRALTRRPALCSGRAEAVRARAERKRARRREPGRRVEAPPPAGPGSHCAAARVREMSYQTHAPAALAQAALIAIHQLASRCVIPRCPPTPPPPPLRTNRTRRVRLVRGEGRGVST